MHGSATPVGPDEEMRDAWRAACVAYRRVRQAGESHHPAHVAAVEALLAVMPHLSRAEASDQVQRAVYWASVTHTAWLWRGVGGKGGKR